MERDVVLALRALGLGDVLAAIPALRGLRRAFPESRLILACPEALRPIVTAANCVDDIADVRSDQVGAGDLGPSRDFDDRIHTVVNLHGRGPSSHRWLEGFSAERRLGHAAAGWSGPEWCEEMHERQRWVRLLEHNGITADANDLHIDPTRLPVPPARSADAVVHVGAALPSRHWPCARFAEVALDLMERGHDVLLTGNEAEIGRALAVAEAVEAARGPGGPSLRVAAGQQSLAQFAATIAGARVLVSADTGAAHLASAFATASVVIFGPVSPRVWGPPAGPHRVLFEESLSSGDPFSGAPDPALLAVTAGDVAGALDSLGI